MWHVAEASRAAEATEVVRALVALGDLDLLYADRYCDRAAAKFAPLCSRSHFAELANETTAIAELTASLRAAAERRDWPLVRLLARHTAGLRARLEAERDLHALAETVYRAGGPAPRASALALGGVLDPRGAESERLAVERRLRFLGEHDPDWATFYGARLAHFAELDRHGVALHDGAGDDGLRQAVLSAIERTDFQSIDHLLDGAAAEPGPRDAERPSVTPRAPRDIDRPFEPGVVRAAERLGLEPVALPAEPDLARCLASWCRWEPGDGGEPPFRADRSYCGRPCPVLGRQTLWESINSLVVLPCATSAGTPYLPRFDAECLLVERFAEDTPDAPSELLTLLGLPRRRGLSRTAIEHAIRGGTAPVCTALGLDPFEFTLTALPFDAYLRLAPARCWGQQPLWTHFDGYRLTREHALRVLVGGDVRYGGADGLYGVGRDYDGDHLLARFAVLHRQRFL